MLLDAYRQREILWRTLIADELRSLQQVGKIRSELDVMEEAGDLIATIDGAGLAWTFHPERYTTARLKRQIDRHILSFLTPDNQDGS